MTNDELSACVAEVRGERESFKVGDNWYVEEPKQYATDYNCAMELFNEMYCLSSGFAIIVREKTDNGSVFACSVTIPGVGVIRSTSTASAAVAICQTYLKVKGVIKQCAP